MITRLIDWKLVQESKLIPRNLEERKEKLKQNNLLILQQEIIEEKIHLDDNWNFSSKEVKVKQINSVILYDNLGYIPEWLAKVKIIERFNCVACNIITLKNCPEYVGGDFLCTLNKLTSLEDMPKYVGGDFYCQYNSKKFTRKDIPEGTIIKGNIIF